MVFMEIAWPDVFGGYLGSQSLHYGAKTKIIG